MMFLKFASECPMKIGHFFRLLIKLVDVRVVFNPQIVDDKLLTLVGVLSHVVFQKLRNGHIMAQDDRLQAHILTDEIAELVGRDLSETFESCDLRMGTERFDGIDTFLVGIAVSRLFLVSHAEQRGLKDVKMSDANHVGVELQEELEHQQADVHTVNIGIGGDDDVIISQIFNGFIDV